VCIIQIHLIVKLAMGDYVFVEGACIFWESARHFIMDVCRSTTLLLSAYPFRKIITLHWSINVHIFRVCASLSNFACFQAAYAFHPFSPEATVTPSSQRQEDSRAPVFQADGRECRTNANQTWLVARAGTLFERARGKSLRFYALARQPRGFAWRTLDSPPRCHHRRCRRR
jgi:hypothetical protein